MNLPASAPTAIRERLGKLTPEQRRTLADRLRQGTSGGGSPPRPTVSIPKASPLRVEDSPRVTIYPASSGQQQMWILHYAAPESPAYSVPSAYDIQGPVDPVVLEASFRELIREHAILRTTFRLEREGVVQCVAEEFHFVLSRVEVRVGEGESTGMVVNRILEQESRRPFDLVRGPLIRAVLVRIGPNDSVLLVVLHHAISDGWSRSIVYAELSRHYAALSEGRRLAPRVAGIGYADYAAWETQRLASGALDLHEEYWKSQLAGDLEPVELPTDRPRASFESHAGARRVEFLKGDWVRRVRELAQREGTTVFVVLLAAYKTLLYRHTGLTDLIVGVPIANRGRVELEGLIGYFVNTLALRTRIQPRATFRQLLSQVKEGVLAAQEHRMIPFERVVANLPGRAASQRASFLRVGFTLQDFPPSILEFPGLQISERHIHTSSSKFELLFQVEPDGDGFKLIAEYASDLFEEARVRQMMLHWRTLLESVVTDPGLPLGRIPILDPVERHRILVEWNGESRSYDRGICLHQLFENQVRRTPDAVALIFGEESLTYAQLDARANVLAHHLQRLGVGPDALVAICLDRSFEMLIGILGILKAGGAYVPIDPSYPQDRIAFMLSDAGAGVVITQDSMRDRFTSESAAIIALDTDFRGMTGDSTEPPKSGVEERHLAYVIYTSGSTGRPKGVLNTHGGVVNQLQWAAETFRLGPEDVLLQKTTFSFDISVWEFFCALQAGAKLVIARPEGHRDNRYIAELVIQHGVTFLQFVPSMLRWFLEESRVSDCTSVRRVICGGEALPVDLQETFFERMGWAELHNLYGPTEAAVYVTHWVCQRDSASRVVPIGRPLANNLTYILDEGFQPVPAGVVGELCIGGVAVARGYHARAELTAERFIPNPHAPTPGSMLYRTGDLARHLPDGSIDFLGRMDHQVKVRGFRIELGEVESVLSSHPAVVASAVVVRSGSAGEGAGLLAYLVPAAKAAISAETLRAWLSERLPDYMVPGEFMEVEALPLTPSGKLDRKALSTLEGRRVDTAREYVEPEQGLEMLLAEEWRKALRRERVGRFDDFFAIGGHSLLAVSICHGLQERLGREVPLHWFLGHPTIAGLARTLFDASTERGEFRIPRADRSKLLPMSHGQQRMWLLHQTLPNPAAYTVCLAWRISGPIDFSRLRDVLSAVQNRHEVLRTALVQENGEWVQRIHPEGTLALDYVEAASNGADLERLLEAEARRMFDLARAPLWRVLWIRDLGGDHVLAISFHHSVVDEWSIRLLVGEVQDLYASGRASSESELPAVATQYADYAVWQRARAGSAEWRRSEVFWRNELRDWPPPLELPTSMPRVENPTGRGSVERFQLDESVVEGLRRLAVDEKTTAFALGLAVFHVWLHRYSGLDDVIIGTPVSERTHADLKGVMGFLLNTLPIRARLDGSMKFRQVLGQLRDSVLKAFQYADYPFDEMVRVAGMDRRSGQSPIYSVMFVLLEESIPLPRLGTATVCREPVRTGTSKCDLLLSINASGDRWECDLEYSNDVFDSESAARMRGHLATLFRSIALEPDRPISELTLMSEDERHTVLVEWNPSSVPLHDPVCLHRWFESQVKRTPESIAAWFGDASLTYHGLNERANRLAHRLLRDGVGPDSPVCFCLDRSLEVLVAVLGILKAGGAYVPLDPTFPTDRLVHMVAGSNARLLVTRTAQASRFSTAQVGLILMEELTGAVDLGNPDVEVHPHHLAYMLYTSGSTGVPKAVAMEHAPLVHLMRWQLEQHPEPLRTLQFASIGFDVSFQEIFSTLLVGGSLLMVDAETCLDPDALWSWIVRSRIQRVFLPVAMLQRLALAAAKFRSVEDELIEVTTAGEALRITKDIREFFARRPGCRLHNHYGPTESHVVTAWTLEGNASDWPELPPIGRPITPARIYLLDAKGQPVPVGLPGEIFIGGASLARGYWAQPERTRERFVEDPFDETRKGRLYKTGDLARHRGDGAMEYLGRMDQQVKIRGLRIELGEVEAVLGGHEAVGSCAVVVEADAAGERFLTAFVVPRIGSSISAGSIQVWMESKLPRFMVPSRYLEVDQLPVNANGKVDRKKLAERAAGSGYGTELAAAAIHVPPSTQTQRILVSIWETVLRRDGIGIQDSFFLLGGHSLLAASICSGIRERLGAEVKMHAVLECGTIDRLSRHMESFALRSQSTEFGKADRSGPLRMSFAQEGVWLLKQKYPGSAALNVGVAWRFVGEVSPGRVRGALERMLQRHEALRTALIAEEGVLLQRVLPQDQAGIDWSVVDLRSLPAVDRERVLSAELDRLDSHDFRLGEPPLWVARWYLLDVHHQVFAVCFDHSIVDEWSLRLFKLELERLYETEGGAEPEGWMPLEYQYVDYAAWQRRSLASDTLLRQEQFWLNLYTELPAPLELPAVRIRPPVASHRGDMIRFKLEAGVVQRLKALARDEQASLYMVGFALFQVWLHRLSGQSDLVIATPIAGRERPEVQSMFGIFINTLPVRTQLDGNMSPREVLREVRRVLMQTFQNAELPYERIIEVVSRPHGREATPLHQTLFVLVEESVSTLRLGTVVGESVTLSNQTSKTDLLLHIDASGPVWECGLEYTTDLFDAAAGERLARQLAEIFRSAATSPDQQVASLQFIGPSEHVQILEEWNQTAREYPSDRCIHELFVELAEKSPDTVALIAGEQTLSYGELNRRSEVLAAQLSRLGVTHGDLIGLRMGRSFETVISLLGILKAGGAYWALEEELPGERLRLLVRDAHPRLILTTQREHASLAKGLNSPVAGESALSVPLHLFEDLLGAEVVPERFVPRSVDPTGPAYVNFTSGSTGEPKGVLIPHRGVVRLVKGVDYANLDASQVLVHLSPLSFDASTFEIWGALLNGGRVVLMPPGVPGLADIGEVIRNHGVTTLWMTAGLFHLMVEERLEDLKPLRQLLAGGDVLSPACVRKARAALPGCRLINGYGPTENTTFTTTFEIVDETTVEGGVPIGKPISNTRVYVLDESRQPVPIGVPGELYTGGDGLALGYLGKPELTAERFVRDPFSKEPGARLYRTGDRVRWRSDGVLEFLGRMDGQVKIRGFRVEMGEIESVLGEHPTVGGCAVCARSTAGGQRDLVAFLVARGGGGVVPDDLRVWLQARLPEYMVPSRFVALDSLPLNANGKVDKKRLVLSVGDTTEGHGEYVKARTVLEAQLIAIWEDVLGRTKVGIDDHFFKLGGTSLLAVRVQARLEKVAGIRMPLVSIFQANTPRKLAALLEDPSKRQHGIALTENRGPIVRPHLFCLHHLSAAQRLAGHLDSAWPVYGIESSLDEDLRRWHMNGEITLTLETLAARNVEIIQQTQPKGPYFLSGFCFGGVLAFEVARQLEAKGERVGLLVLLDASYFPGVRRKSFPQLRRWFYHSRRAIGEGPRYFLRKWTERARLQRKRQSRLEELFEMADETDSAVKTKDRWPRADFMSRLLEAYQGGPYSGSALLIRTVEEPRSFTLDLGETSGWEKVIHGGLQAEDIHCKHTDITEEPFIGLVAKRILARLEAS